MKNFKITVTDNFFGEELTGNFLAETEFDAVKECLDFYACALDTLPEHIEVLDIECTD